jgi:hypothetical protein
MQLQLATVTSSFPFTLVAGATSKETSTKKTVFYHADRWKQEGNLLIRLHKRPRKSLFIPVGTKDLPVDNEELIDLRITEVTFENGKTQTLADNWRTNEDPTSVLDPSQTWTGRTVFKLKSAPPDKRLKSKTNTDRVKEPELKVTSEGTTSTSLSRLVRPPERRDGGTFNVEFGTEALRSLVLKLWKETDSETGQTKTTDTWHRLPCCWVRLHHEPRTNLFVPRLDDPQLVHKELRTL